MNWKWVVYSIRTLVFASCETSAIEFPANVPSFAFANFIWRHDELFLLPQAGSSNFSDWQAWWTKLHLIAMNQVTFDGISANYSGAGFTGRSSMRSLIQQKLNFDAWVRKRESLVLTMSLRMGVKKSPQGLLGSTSNEKLAGIWSPIAHHHDQTQFQYYNSNWTRSIFHGQR